MSTEEGSNGCCYLCNECAKSFPTLDELEGHMASHGQANEHHHDNSTNINVDDDDDGDDDDDDDDDGRSRVEKTETGHSPSSSDTSTFAGDGGFDVGPGPNGKGKIFRCRFCPKTFETRSHLNIHYTHTHRDKPQYECEVCRMVFSVKRELSTHARIHTGEEPHSCTQCGKQFGTRQLLKKHWMWHTGERSHVCPHCGKAFFQKGHLTQHLMIHAGGRPHQCNLCSKTFIFKFDLNRHMKIHAERGYTCDRCNRAFLKESSLEEHLTRCTKSRPASSAGRETPMSEKSMSMSVAGTPAPTPATPQQQQQHQSPDDQPPPSMVNGVATPQQLIQQQQQQGQQQFFCFFCMRQFASQAAYTLHLSFVHFRNGVLNPAPHSVSANGHVQQLNGLPNGAENGNGEQKTEQQSSANNSMTGSELHQSFKMESSNCSKTKAECNSCTNWIKRCADMERQVAIRDAEIRRLRENMGRVNGIAGNLLESCTDFDKLWMLHSKKVYTQIQSVLCGIE